jgi:predicted nucleic acid-binding protein
VICVDTSVWVEAFRNARSPVALHLGELMESDEVAVPAPARIEILSGVSVRALEPLADGFSGVGVLYPGPADWQRIEGWVRSAVRAGERFGVVDLMIGALAAEQGMKVWSLDADFARMERLGFVQRYASS